MQRRSSMIFRISEAEREQYAALCAEMRTNSNRGGGGEPWRVSTRKSYWDDYVASLRCLFKEGLYDLEAAPDSRWTIENIEMLVRSTKPNGKPYAANTLRFRLIGTDMVLKVIAPKHNCSCLLAPLARLERRRHKKEVHRRS
jgi:hypothetical protein